MHACMHETSSTISLHISSPIAAAVRGTGSAASLSAAARTAARIPSSASASPGASEVQPGDPGDPRDRRGAMVGPETAGC